MDLALNNQQRLKSHEPKPTNKHHVMKFFNRIKKKNKY